MTSPESRKTLNNDVLFKTLRELNPTPQQLKEIEILERIVSTREGTTGAGKKVHVRRGPMHAAHRRS